jgi:hypothetical protein
MDRVAPHTLQGIAAPSRHLVSYWPVSNLGLREVNQPSTAELFGIPLVNPLLGKFPPSTHEIISTSELCR